MCQLLMNWITFDMTDLADLRHDNGRGQMAFDSMAINPIDQMQYWIDDAIAAGYFQANSMALSTVSSEGKPSSRIVLLKELNDEGLVFYTNYQSQKGQELAEHPFACALFYWDQLERQIRVEGSISKIAVERSDAYFSSRPKASQLGAAVSPQSQEIEGPGFLQEEFNKLCEQYAEADIPRPESWGGYCLKPEKIEFWQGRPSRLHDRFVYVQDGENWKTKVLAP